MQRPSLDVMAAQWALGGCVLGPRGCGRFGGATTAVSGPPRIRQRRSGARFSGQDQPGDCSMELEAVLKERAATAGDPGRVLGAWVRRGWSAAGPSAEPEVGGGVINASTLESTTNRPRELGSKDSEPEYEALPEGSTVTTHMLAGAVAGIMEHCLMYPVDCVKTRMQSLQPDPAARYRNVMEALCKIIRTEGIWRPMRGMNVTATGAGPAHALYFACYEKLKKTLSDVIRPGGNSHIANGIDDSCPT